MRNITKHNSKIILTLILISSYCNFINCNIDAIPIRSDELSYPLWVIDDFGRNVTIPRYPERIVSLAPSVTEMLFAIDAGDRVFGVTEFCDHPPEVLKSVEEGEIKVIGGYQDPNIEAIISIQPDIVISATTLQSEVISNLEDKGSVVIGLNPKNIDQILSDIELIGAVSGQTVMAEKLVYSLRKRIEYVSCRVEEISHEIPVYYELWFDPLMTVGPGTWIDEIIGLGGGINIFHDTKSPYPTINPEAVIERDPELIIIPLQYMGTTSIEDFKKRPGWISIAAVKEGRIHEIDEDLVLRPGPRLIDGLEQVTLLMHPELYTGRIVIDEDIILTTNSSINEYVYDASRKLINFTVNGPEGFIGVLNITFRKSMIEGPPIVLLNGVETPFDLLKNETHYSIYFSYEQSSHYVTIGGTYTIPEYNIEIIPLTITIFATLFILKRFRSVNRRYYLRRASATFRS